MTNKIIHFIGIGGIGMSSLSQWFLAENWLVSGSDLTESGITNDLARIGIKVRIGHKKGNLPAGGPDLVVYSQAVRDENPELRQARKLGIKTLSYPQAVGLLTKRYDTIAISGAHGKSTTTALASLVLMKAGFDPTVIIGTKLKELVPRRGGSNFRYGHSQYLVLEADEWKASFLHYSPAFLIITNIDREHLDFYKNLGNVKESFLKLISRIKKGGSLILNRDDENLFSLRKKISSIAKKRKLKIIWYTLKNVKDVKKIKKAIEIPGEHNISNALAVLSLSRLLKIPDRKSLKAIGEYRGSWRRMEYRGKWQMANGKWQISVYDDYAHHPTEIKATLKAFREKFPNKKIICVFQPHQAKRLASLFPEFQTSFDDADITLILPIYEVAGRDKVSSRFTSEKLVKEIQKKQPKKLIFYLGDPENLKKALTALMSSTSLPRKSASSQRKSAVMVMMGAGDIVNYTDSLIR